MNRILTLLPFILLALLAGYLFVVAASSRPRYSPPGAFVVQL